MDSNVRIIREVQVSSSSDIDRLVVSLIFKKGFSVDARGVYLDVRPFAGQAKRSSMPYGQLVYKTKTISAKKFAAVEIPSEEMIEKYVKKAANELNLTTKS